jgi:opacity protein-like surface antigen
VIRKLTWMVAVGALACSAAWAQDPRVEIGGTAGWTFSDGVGGANAVIVPGVGTFSRIDPKDAFSWGLRVGFMVNENVEVGGLFNQQSTSLEISGTTTVKLGDEKLYNYHGYFAYNFGDSDAKARPYVLGGLGATQFGSVAVNVGGQQRDIGGNTKFSTTWALGVKVYPGKSVGLRLEGRWTPTYIKSDAAGWWCDPYWGCYVVGNAQYANQFELSGGINLRF